MQYAYPCSSSGRLWWTPALQYKHVWSVDDRCEDLPGSLGLWDLLWTHRISCLHHHCQMGVWPLNDTFLFAVLCNFFSVFLLLLLILLNLFMWFLVSTIFHIFYFMISTLSSPFWFFFSSFSPPVLLFSSALCSTSIFSNFFFLSFQLLFHSSLALLFLPLFVSFLCLFAFLLPLNQSVILLNFKCVYSVDVIAISVAEDEAVEGRVSWEESVHAAGRSRLLLRCSRSDAAFLFWGDNQIKN